MINTIQQIVRGFLLFGVLLFPLSYSSQAYSAPCTGDELIDVTLPAGSRWDLCWELRDKEGVVLKDITYTTPAGMSRRVMKEASLSQLHIALDDGSLRFNGVTDIANGGGLGVAGNRHDLVSNDCADGTLRSLAGNSVLCQVVKRRGYIYKYYGSSKQGHALHLSSRATIKGNTYIIRWRLFDDGTIEPAVGLTGELPKIGADARYGWELDNTGRVGVSYNNTYYFRLDFDIGSNASNDFAQEIEITNSANRLRKSMTVRDINVESSRSINENLKRSWRIVDKNTTNSGGNLVSYHLEPLHTAHRYRGTTSQPWAEHDFHVTRFKDCERHATDNPTTNGCGADITDFVNGENVNSANAVLWYRINYHHVPRSEDEPEVPVHWDSFILMPRDWTNTNPLVINNNTQFSELNLGGA